MKKFTMISIFIVALSIAIVPIRSDKIDTSSRIHFITENIDWKFYQDLDKIHQAIRLRHAVSELKLDSELSNAARQRAIVRAWYENNPPSEAHDGDVGEAVHYTINPDEILSAEQIMNTWYTQEERQYNYDNPTVTESNRRFVQIVSKTTTNYGCGQVRSTAQSSGAGIYTVCLYSPIYQSGNEQANIERPIFDFENDKFDFSMTDDLKIGLASRLEGVPIKTKRV